MITNNYRHYLLDCLLLTCAVAAVYGRLIGADFQAQWDDNIYILNNEAVRGFTLEHIRAAFRIGAGSIGQYNPLSLLSFMADYTLWGLWPGGYHLSSIVIHLLNGVLIYRLLLRMHGQRMISLLAALIFLLHPVQVESVAWISERKGLLSLFFMLVSWEWYCRYREAGEEAGRGAYAVSLMAYLLSLLAKSLSVVLPLVLILYDWCFAGKERRLRICDKLPFLAAAVVFSGIEMYSEAPAQGGSLAGYHGGSPLATFYTMLPVFCRYLGLLVWPAGLNVEHMPPVYRSLELPVAAAALLLAALLFAAVRLYRADHRLGFWIMFFWISLLPVSQVVPLFLLMYEHYLYMPIIGVGTLVGAVAVSARERLGPQRSFILYAVLVLWLLLLSVTSFQRTAVWKDSLLLFSDAAQKSPRSFRVWEVLGEIHRSHGAISASKTALEKSLSLKPDNTDVLWNLADLSTEAGDLGEGASYSERLLALNPKYVKGWATLGNNYRNRGNYSRAKEMYNRALALQPDAIQVVTLLGKLALLENRLDDARGLFIRVEKEGSVLSLTENAYLLACVESLAGRTGEALTWLEKSLQRGYRDYAALATDTRLTALWKEPRFNYLLLQYVPELEEKR